VLPDLRDHVTPERIDELLKSGETNLEHLREQVEREEHLRKMFEGAGEKYTSLKKISFGFLSIW
jgi:hypothetical protein